MREHFYEIDSGFNIRDIYWFQLKLCALVHFALTSKNIIFAQWNHNAQMDIQSLSWQPILSGLRSIDTQC